jgi:metallo-beta-lactamase class B
MPVAAFGLLALTFLLALPQASSSFKADPPMVCPSCEEWNGPREPFRIFGNTYFVGMAGVSSVLITSDTGLILLDGGLSQSAPAIDANIRRLGFRTEDIRLIGASHEHYDHVGGIAALQRFTGAPVAMSEPGTRALAQGLPTADDPQIGFGREVNAFPRVNNLRVAADGETLRVGSLAITAHHTPGHTPGAVTWSWRSCEGSRCADIVYVDSLNPISAPGFRFTGGGGQPSRAAAFRRSLEKVAALPCDIVIAVHPAAADLDGKLKGRASNPAADPFFDANGCRAYAAGLAKRLESRIAEEAR